MLTRRDFLIGSAMGVTTLGTSCGQNDDLSERLKKFNRPYARMNFSPSDPGPVPITKLSGAPWWPENVARPTCVDGHKMSFIGQFRLDEVPNQQQPPSLFSFHYCEQCMFDGTMPLGWEDEGHQLRYNLSIFPNLDAPIDALGIVAESSISPLTPVLEQGVETLNIEDIWEKFPETAVPGGIPGLESIPHENRNKLGGWPSWVQHPIRPVDKSRGVMWFVGQLDCVVCPDCYTFLFASDVATGRQEAEMVLQTT